MMYRIRFGLVDINWEHHLTPASETTCNTRGHSCRFLLPHCKIKTYASSFFPKTSCYWNSMKIDPASYTSLDSFKEALPGALKKKTP